MERIKEREALSECYYPFLPLYFFWIQRARKRVRKARGWLKVFTGGVKKKKETVNYSTAIPIIFFHWENWWHDKLVIKQKTIHLSDGTRPRRRAGSQAGAGDLSGIQRNVWVGCVQASRRCLLAHRTHEWQMMKTRTHTHARAHTHFHVRMKKFVMAKKLFLLLGYDQSFAVTNEVLVLSIH